MYTLAFQAKIWLNKIRFKTNRNFNKNAKHKNEKSSVRDSSHGRKRDFQAEPENRPRNFPKPTVK